MKKRTLPKFNDNDGKCAVAPVEKKRVRQFDHVDGNWPTFVCVELKLDEGSSVVVEARDMLKAAGTANWVADGEVHEIEEPHLSLSKTFPIREHHIEPFVKDIGLALTSFARFSMSCSGLKLYWSENESRVFAGLLVGKGTAEIIEMIHAVDKVLEEYGKPIYFENPEPHISLFWGLANSDKEKEQVVKETSSSIDLQVDSISIKNG